MSGCGGGGDTTAASDAAAGGTTGSSTTTSGATTTSTSTTALGATRSGQGTYYGATGQGACSFDASSDLMVAAMNHTDYAGSAACGEYVSITGPLGTVTVRITDECPECAAGDIDLSAQAFAKIADPVAGRVPITWQVVAGDVSGPVQYRYKEGSTRYWTAIQVRNHRLPIAKLEIAPAGATNWIAVTRETYNYFVYPTTINAGALQVRITSSTGAVLQDTLPEPQGGLLVDGAAQFP
ncbi:MAG TPA: expansin EXLX1 family cellulose-binding protein [Burkholderiaceae bacterium]|nr:expansin EXLX1 family cellulose-binding protein [Burkholderiaceae bacterium]